MLSEYPQSVFQVFFGVAKGGQQQLATQTLRVHLPSVENCIRGPRIEVGKSFVMISAVN